MSDFYLALGDSLTAGYGVGLSRSFATIYYHIIKSLRAGISYFNFGVNGLNTGGLVQMLASRRIGELVPQAGLITITIGSNDLLSAAKGTLQGQGEYLPRTINNALINLDRSGLAIRASNRTARIQIAALYNPLAAGPYQQFGGQAQALIKGFNQGLAGWAAKYNATLVPVDRAFLGKENLLLGPDFFHPNSAGHQVMAGLFARYP